MHNIEPANGTVSSRPSDMAELIAAHDWASTSLGPMSAWQQSLKTAVEVILPMGFPMVVLWGPDLIQIYNDAYRELMRGKHPDGLGQPTRLCWPETWHVNRPTYERVLAGETCVIEDALYPVVRSGALKDAWFTLSCSPLHGDDGPIAGVVVSLVETTARHRRDQFRATCDATDRDESQARLREAEERHRADLEREVQERTAELKQSRDLLQATMNATPDLIQVFEAVRDASGEIVDFVWVLNNQAAALIFGDVIGERLTEHNPGVVVEGIFDTFKRVVETGQPSRNERHYVHEQFDGWFLQSAVKLGDGLTTTTADITEQKKAQENLLRLHKEMARDKVRELERLFRGFAEASSDLIWIRDAESLAFEYSNAAFRSAYGLDGPAPPEEATAWRDRVHPGDRDRVLAEMRKVLAGDHVTQDFRILHARGGEMRWVRTTDFPLRDASGRVTRIGGIGQDVTDEKEAAQRLGVLVAELQHRTRNLLGVIRALAGRTLASSASLAEFKTRFEDRLGALARVNGLLSRLEEGDRITFDELIRTELRGHGALEDDWSGPQVGLSGPHGVRLRSANVQTFALALHELATNALKHGALSTATGRLDVSWDVIFDPHGTPRLKVDWRETGVSPCEDAETRGGYGRELIEQALPYQLNAEVAYRLTRRGVSCTIVLPLSAASERAGAGP